jgi:hypothetical protein
MDIIRSNYSTLGPYAQQEAPKAPEYPYTDILDAYREASEAADREATYNIREYDEHNHTGGVGFQRILDRLGFGDYFKEDADKEIANDMAERWVAFAATGSPNYGESRVNWRPWRYVLDEKRRGNRYRDFWRSEGSGFDDIFNLDDISDEDRGSASSTTGFQWSDVFEERVFRQRILGALGMEVASEDVFQTMLRRISKSSDEQQDYSLNSLLFGSVTGNSKEGNNEQQRTHKALRELQQIAQDMRIMGTGLRGDVRRGQETWQDDFFPQILELKWPPEDRLVERDCTCDMWDRKRCKFCIQLVL